MGGVFTATGFPPPGSAVNADEPAAAYRGGFALVRALPDAPTNVTATPGDTTATVTWQAPAYTGGGPVTSYAIVVDPDGTVLTDVTSPTTVTGLTNGAAYTFSVFAVTSAGIGEAGVSNTVTPQPVPGAPTGVTGAPGDGQVSVSFTPPAPNGGAGDHGLHRHRAAGEHLVDRHDRARSRSAASRTARPTPSPSRPRTRSAPRRRPRRRARSRRAPCPGAPTERRRDGREHAGDRQLRRAGPDGGAADHRVHGDLVAREHHGARHDEPDHRDRPHERPAATRSPSTATNAAGPGAASSASNSVTPTLGAHRARFPDGRVGHAGQRRSDRQLHAARVERRLGHHGLHRDLVAGEHHRDRHGEPDRRHGPHQRPELHVHRHGDERHRHRACVVGVRTGRPGRGATASGARPTPRNTPAGSTRLRSSRRRAAATTGALRPGVTSRMRMCSDVDLLQRQARGPRRPAGGGRARGDTEPASNSNSGHTITAWPRAASSRVPPAGCRPRR